MNETSDRRAYRRVNIDAEVRVRASGSNGRGLACRMSDASQGGVSVITEEAPQTDHIWVDILTTAGHQVGEPLNARILRVDPRPEGGYRVACTFDATE